MAPAHDTRRSRRPLAGREPEPSRAHGQAARRRPVAARTGAAAARAGARGARGAPPRRASRRWPGTIRAIRRGCSRFPTARRCCGAGAGSTRSTRPPWPSSARARRRWPVSRLRIVWPPIWPRAASPSSADWPEAWTARRTVAPLRAGRTVAVMASGADRVYPPEHEALAREISGAGLVISEYAPGTAPLPFRFPAAKPGDQRARRRRDRRRGVRAIGLAHHRGVRARSGARGDGRAGERPRRAQPRRPRAHPRRRKDCRVCGRYRRRAAAPAGMERRRSCRSKRRDANRLRACRARAHGGRDELSRSTGWRRSRALPDRRFWPS